MNPHVDRPAEMPIKFASAIPQLICLLGNFFLNKSVFVAPAKSASSTTILGNSIPRLTNSSP